MAGLGNLTGKVALITGASSGIGRATALLFSRLGAQLSITGRNEKNLEQVAQECLELTGNKKCTCSIFLHNSCGSSSRYFRCSWCSAEWRCTNCSYRIDQYPLVLGAVSIRGYMPFSVTGDLSDEADVKIVMDRTLQNYDQLDVLVNNAGIIETGSIENTSLLQFDRMFNTNVRSIYHLTMLAVPHLIETKGNIVNVSSVNGLRAFANVLAYNMSKSAVDQFTRTVALELAPKQVRVNSVNPGVTVTQLQRRGGLDDEAYEKFLERSKSTHALGRPGCPEEIARAIAFLASDSASFITGATLPVDGGRHAMCPR